MLIGSVFVAYNAARIMPLKWNIETPMPEWKMH
jgi:hypothetical protein